MVEQVACTRKAENDKHVNLAISIESIDGPINSLTNLINMVEGKAVYREEKTGAEPPPPTPPPPSLLAVLEEGHNSIEAKVTELEDLISHLRVLLFG